MNHFLAIALSASLMQTYIGQDPNGYPDTAIEWRSNARKEDQEPIFVSKGSSYIYNPYPDSINVIVSIIKADNISFTLTIPGADFKAIPNEKLKVLISCDEDHFCIEDILPNHLYEIRYDKKTGCYCLASTELLRYTE